MTRNTTKKLIRSKVRLRRRQAGDARTLNPVGLRPEPVEGPSTSSGRTPTVMRAPVCRCARGGGSRGSPPLLDTRAPVCRCARGGGSRGSPPLLDTSRDLDLLDRVVLGDFVGDRLQALGQLGHTRAALEERVPE